MRIFGILLVRDAADLVRVNVLHHLSFGCERILVTDNGSTDGTREVLDRLARRTPLSWRADDGPYDQSKLLTELARWATAEGADWLLPLDADEFWAASQPFATILREAEEAGAGAIMAPRTHFIQRREQARSTPRGLLTMTRVVRDVLPAGTEAVERGSSGAVSVFECPPGAKIVPRATPGLVLQRGGHDADGLAGPVRDEPRVQVLHAALRSREAMAKREQHARRVNAAGGAETQDWHAKRWGRNLEAGRIDAEWRAHSYRDGALDVDGRGVPVFEDTRLRDAVTPFVRGRAAQAAARALRRSY